MTGARGAPQLVTNLVDHGFPETGLLSSRTYV